MAVEKVRHEREQRVLSRLVQAQEENISFRVQGLGHRQRQSSPSGPAITYHMGEWDQVVSYQPEDLVVTAEAGLPISQLNRLLGEHRQWIPLHVADSQDDTVGGAVASGVDGIWRGGYGPFRDRILGMRVLTPGFGAIQVGSKVVKSVAGYNLPRVFVGTRGALGIITEVTLKVSPKPPLTCCWVWEGPLPELVTQARRLESLVAPWASLTLSREESGHLILRAYWHGRAPTMDFLLGQLGEGQSPSSAEGFGPRTVAPIVLKGAVPRRELEALFKVWGDGYLVAELQFGGIFGAALTVGQAHTIMSWIRQRSGGVEVLSGPNPNVPALPSLPDVWKRLKEAYDPAGILG